MKKQVEFWLDFAEKDIKAAKKLAEDPELTQSTAFHCHQAVEKMIKAVLESGDHRIPKIHDLEVLLSRAEAILKLAINEEVLKKLNEVYIDSRYPSDVGLIPNGIPSSQTINDFLNFTKNLYKKIAEHLENM
jgi:HEPN domain-containing protein